MSYQSQNGPLHTQPAASRTSEEYAAPLPPPSSADASPYGTVNSTALSVPGKAQQHARTPSSSSIADQHRRDSAAYTSNGVAIPPPVVVVQQPTAQSAMTADHSRQQQQVDGESHIGASFGGGSGGSQRRDALLAAGLATSDEADDGAHGRVKNSAAASEGWRPNGYDQYGNDALARALADEEAEEKRRNEGGCCCCCGTRGSDGVEATCCICVLCCGLGQLFGFR
ncbi:hypothetical protein SYNPS1DRAFT_27226 [Syncephalis pseudoplumigaleata]|uniref:Uncharacterized protein n=1 Tax=Syncephalis pseudoplumigaleata TaxID=1712513 RepID=A0A4V1J228_9FUNG|nr:hypothetical protein SYNPS1DRAFT_27226 [Syncephalis pseudoplumigaleata]|eukprot:RKP27109.1 hypothetical protein SYNPS1DRAFT_27226 [Syncephalis pseudoplumigaleata]